MKFFLIILFISFVYAQTENIDTTKNKNLNLDSPKLNLLDLKYSMQFNSMKFSPNTFNSIDLYLQSNDSKSIIDFNKNMILKPLQLEYNRNKPGLFTEILSTIKTGAVLYMLGTHLNKFGDMYKEDFGSENNHKMQRSKWKE